MKKTKKTKTPETTPAIGHTFKPAATFDPTARQRQAMREGRNDNYQSLTDAGLGKMILLNYRTVTLRDFLSVSASLGVPVEERKEWFAAFAEEAVKSGKLREIPSCDASEKVYKVTL